ncbi:MAG: hypothetical protein HDR06_15970 [Lachnospiraceae bacterium]|nr:hypothetical protein [Lachnospiraceae bacterium]
MKQVFKRIISFSLSICIIVVSVLLCPISSYAVYEPGTSWWDKFATETSTYLSYLASRVGAIVQDHDFAQWYQNREDYKEWWNTGHISRLEDSNGNVSYSFDADLVAQFKQALIEYSQETNGFYLLPTTDYRTVPVELFATAPQYRTFKNIIEEKGMLAVSIPYSASYSFRFVDPFSDPDNAVSLVGSSSMINTLDQRPWMPVSANFYGFNDWKLKEYRFQVFPDLDTVYHTSAVAVDWNTGGTNDIKNSAMVNFDMSNHGSYGHDSVIIYSTSGEKIRVFVSLTAMKNYSVDRRTVYFSKDFYDFVPSDITATWDEINDRIEHIDDILQQLLDKIGDSDDENRIEELLQEILDAIKNGGGNGDNQGGNGGGNTGTGGGGIGGAISQWYEDVLDYLEKILKQLKSIKRWTVVNTVINGVDAIADWLDLIHDILSDVDDGMESAVATLSDALGDATGLLKSKFPFSVPWDIFFFVTLLAAEPETPHFEVPIDFDVSALDMHIHYDFVVDFSDYQYLSDICRVVLSMTYAVGLMKMTAGIVNTKKEE